MNTLSHEKEKVEMVTRQVVEALQTCSQEDMVLKQRLEAGDASIASEMTRGARYLMDLDGWKCDRAFAQHVSFFFT
jgi:hypothetical protein